MVLHPPSFLICRIRVKQPVLPIRKVSHGRALQHLLHIVTIVTYAMVDLLLIATRIITRNSLGGPEGGL